MAYVGTPAHTRPMPTVTDLLDFEEKWGRDPHRQPAKLEACYTELGISPARYFQLLGRAIDTVEAVEYAPMLVKRLRRLRDARLAAQRRRVS